MAEHENTQGPKGMPFLNYIFGLVFIAVGATVGQHWDVPVPGLELNLGKTLAMAGMMLILFPVVKMFYIQPLEQAVNDRNNNLESTFAEADSLKARMEELKGSYENKLTQAEAEARTQIQTALNEANEMKQKILAEAKTQADEVKARGAEEMERERAKMLVDLRTHVVDLTLNATEKIIGKSMDEGKQRELVAQFIETAEVGR